VNGPKTADFSDSSKELLSKTHRTAKGVAEDINAFVMNKAVAKIRELANAIDSFHVRDDGDKWAYREAWETLVRVANPMIPHLCEELWEQLGHKTLLTDTPWPTVDETLLVSDTVTIAVQVNGKLRATISLPKDTQQKDAETAAMNEEGVQKALTGLSVKKVIVVPNRIVNIVAAA